MLFLNMVSPNENELCESSGVSRIVCKAVAVSCSLSPRFADSLRRNVRTPDALMAPARLSKHELRAGSLSFLVACAVATPTWAAPAEALAQARAVYAEVNQNAPRMTTTRFRARVPAAEYTSEVVASSEQGQVRRLAVTDPDDSGNVLTDLYFTREGALVLPCVPRRDTRPTGKSERATNTACILSKAGWCTCWQEWTRLQYLPAIHWPAPRRPSPRAWLWPCAKQPWHPLRPL